MGANEKYWKEVAEAATGNRPKKETKSFVSHDIPAAKNKTTEGHASQGHVTDAKGTATTTGEPTLRLATRDSSRMPKSDNDDGPTGGNIR